jgi:hypothetical protein
MNDRSAATFLEQTGSTRDADGRNRTIVVYNPNFQEQPGIDAIFPDLTVQVFPCWCHASIPCTSHMVFVLLSLGYKLIGEGNTTLHIQCSKEITRQQT